MLRRIFLGLAFAIGLLSGSIGADALTPDQRAILLVAPQPSLNLDFRACSGIDSRISFTRAANTATFFGSNLLLQTANANIPRLDFNYATGACNGFFIEQASTNVALQNRDLTNAAWVKVTATAAKDQIGIDGAANSASSLTATSGLATALQTVVHVSSTDTYSVYLKCITCTGAIALSVDGTTFTTANSSICTLGNGSGAVASNLLTTAWVRCTLTQAAVVNPAFGIRISNNADKIAVDYSQLEVLGFPTSPILTTTVAVTRNADVATMLVSSFPYNQSQGTIYAQFINAFVASGGVTVYSIDNGALTDAIRLLAPNGSPQDSTIVTVGGVIQSTLTFTSVLAANVVQKDAFAYGLSGFAHTFGGVTPSTGTGSIPTVTTLRLGSQPGGAQVNGWLQQVKYWPLRLSNQQLIQMTRPGQQSMLTPANENHEIKIAVNQ